MMDSDALAEFWTATPKPGFHDFFAIVKIGQGRFAKKEVSMAKIYVANPLHKAADEAIQINGALGYSKDTVLEWICRYARQARLVDGADEAHQMVLNRRSTEEDRDFWKWDVA